ncbi:MAG: hypothetical protein D6713_10015 [Deltaproteobacteria bacterium]|nr:MAG: hypothetical protein D6713_10015 [Deltaproteobacteria bacterium]
MKIFAIIGSPRKRGNSEMGARFLASLASAESFQFVRLASKTIKDCRACYRCLEGSCPLEDDYGLILEKILEADGVIVAFPSYFFGENAAAKRFLDRGLQFYRHFETLRGKPAVGFVTAGMEFGEGYAKLALDNMIERMGLENRGTDVLYGALPGEIFLRKENFGKMEKLAGALTGGERVRREGEISCEVCGYSYFDFAREGTVSCLICGTRYEVKVSPELSRIEGSGVHLFDLDKLVEHRQWLIGMKQRFLAVRDELKRVIAENLRPGEEI